ncbi:hypothetical protein BaRGS_00031514 [Batillaria attramentaria]|uniref:Uncharacterized protein n=1 Tax=Batillaria attramentaria TaxID=370345 RepID=A0ABD0JQY6_9CAEN
MSIREWNIEYDQKVKEVLQKRLTGERQSRDNYHIIKTFGISEFGGLQQVIRLKSGKIMVPEERKQDLIFAMPHETGSKKNEKKTQKASRLTLFTKNKTKQKTLGLTKIPKHTMSIFPPV